ncbi:type II secretion system protein [Paenibacillus qinlingensis]|uniref:Prepilin-type N-terminal cleavage/methylation domain-containing protein n=1 Tax=Paenibacillus qinlingensis TaxID=1837343 RepID=A0ABU1NQD9_9BACL|nr:type II secretion system protein [Paenibacillus qinlingensis]MDR6549665.1 prepilin-type N-terminal cleavage/methylation domain-containing protein [Paenibacillus qinlingensis]
MSKRKERDEGFTLIEVLAATVILSVASLAMMTFFINAMSYNKGNQNKMVMVNLARNALFYMEKQRFNDVKNYFANVDEVEDGNPVITFAGCSYDGTLHCSQSSKRDYLINFSGIQNILSPNINGRDYEITITYQKDVDQENLQKSAVNGNVNQYLIPIRVNVKSASNPNMRNQTFVEGYVINEQIR